MLEVGPKSTDAACSCKNVCFEVDGILTLFHDISIMLDLWIRYVCWVVGCLRL